MLLIKTSSCSHSLVLAIALLVTIELTACSSGSLNSQTAGEEGNQNTASIFLEKPADTGSTISTDNNENTPRLEASFNSAGEPITNPDNFIVNESNGIKIEMPVFDTSMIDFAFIELNMALTVPAFTIRITNNSANTISFTSCTTVAFKNGDEVAKAFATPGSDNLRPGDTIIDTSRFYGVNYGKDMDTARVSCSWTYRDTDIKDDDPLIVFELIEYLSNESNNPVLVGQVTNNSAKTIYAVYCDYVLRKGNEVIGDMNLVFNDWGNIAPGEAYKATSSIAIAYGVVQFQDFDSDEFDRNDLYCSYTERG